MVCEAHICVKPHVDPSKQKVEEAIDNFVKRIEADLKSFAQDYDTYISDMYKCQWNCYSILQSSFYLTDTQIVGENITQDQFMGPIDCAAASATKCSAADRKDIIKYAHKADKRLNEAFRTMAIERQTCYNLLDSWWRAGPPLFFMMSIEREIGLIFGGKANEQFSDGFQIVIDDEIIVFGAVSTQVDYVEGDAENDVEGENL